MPQLSIYDVARLALAYWTRADAIIMTAICGAESGYYDDASGDSLHVLACYRAYNTAYPCDTRLPAYVIARAWVDQTYGPYACDEQTSFGLWQVNTYWQRYLLQEVTGHTDPCRWRTYLFDGANNAYVAHRVWLSQGFGAWSTYNVRAHERFLVDATMAVDYVLARPTPAPPPVPPAGGAPPLTPVVPPAASVVPPAAVPPP